MKSRIAMVMMAGLVGLSGCEKPPPPPPPPPPPKKEAPPPPQPIEVGPILSEMKPDARVQFPQERAPIDEGMARATIQLADALARGDAKKLESLLEGESKSVLSSLVASGGWDEGTKKIEAVRITLMSETGDGGGQVVTAIQEPGAAYALVWQASKVGESFVFKALPAVDEVQRRATDWDGKNALLAVNYQPVTEALDPIQAMRQAAKDAGMSDDQIKEIEDGIRKQTPGGPITIPTRRPDGPGGG